MSQSNTNNSFKELLSTASNNLLKKPLTDTLNSISNMASFHSTSSSSSLPTSATSNKNDSQENKYKSTSNNNSYQTQSSISSTYTYSAGTGASNGAVSKFGFTDENANDTKPQKNKIEQLDFLSTVGTGTFGRVIVVRQKNTHEYYALKIMSIAEVLRLKQTEHVKNEKEILQQVFHPFIINLYWTSHNDKFLYMLLEYVCGGELFSYLRNAIKFPSETAIFYSAEIICALEYLHGQSIIYRDLKPENLLLDRQGHIRICDFGFAKKVVDRTWTLCGTPEYLAPEIIQGKGHHKAVDWWALGILIYEMLAGYPPFYDENPFQIYQKILASKIDWPRHIDLIAKDLIKKLLVSDRTKRLGTMKNGSEDIKRHKWYKSIEWEQVVQKKLPPPIIPKVNHDGDTKNFDRYDEDGWRDVPTISGKNLQPFETF